MVVFLGRARSQGWGWLSYHLLLCILVTSLATTVGELCFYWTSPQKIHYRVFWCSNYPDVLDRSFCCGNCSEPYCCSSAKDRQNMFPCLSFPNPDPRDRRTTDDPKVEMDSYISYVTAIVACTVVVVLASVAIGCCFRIWWLPRNRQQNISLPLRRLRSDLNCASSYHQFPSPDSVEDLPDPTASQPTSDVQPVVQSGDGNAGFQGEGAQPSPGSQLDSVQGMEEPSSPPLSHSSPILWHSDAEEFHGIELSWHTATPSTGNKLRSDDAPSNSAEYPNYFWGLAASQTLASLEDSSEAESSAQDDPEFQQVDLSDVPPRCSPTASPSIHPEDSPPCHVAPPCHVQVLAGASDTPPGEEEHRATPGATEDDGATEMSTVSPPDLLDAAVNGHILVQVVPSQTISDESRGAGSDSTRL